MTDVDEQAGASTRDESGQPATGGASAEIVIPRRAWLALAVSAAGFMLVTWNTTATNLAFKSINETFADSDQTTVGWVASSFFIALGAFLPLGGRLADRLGRRRIFRAGLVVTAIAAVLSAIAPTIWVLIGARALQAVGGVRW